MNNILHPPLVLRSVSALMIAVLILQYFLNGIVIALPVITAAILIALSLTFQKWPRISTGIALLPGILIPALVLFGYLNGTAPLWLLIFDWMIFGWVVLSSLKLLLHRETDDEDT